MKKIFKRGMSGLLAVLMAFTMLAGFGTTTAFAASETAESYMISFPRDGDAAQIYSEDAWGHSAKSYMNGWATGSSNYTTLHCMDSFDGKVCYCIEPGLSRNVGDTYHGFGEDFWDNYPSQYNNTIEPDDIKLLLGRIMQYGYQGNLSTSWRSQNDSDADKLAHAFATQLLVWETVVGERDADFDHVSTGGYDEILSLVSPNHPLYSRIMDYYDSIESSVQSHAVCPSFMSRSSGGAKTIELAWDGSQYIAELTDTNHVLSQFTFSASETGFHFSVSGNTLTITTDTAPSGNVTISASRSASRCGVLVWTDYKYGPNGGVQDTITYTASVSDPVRAFLKLKVSYGGAKIIKTSEDGRVDGITFTITGEGVNQTVTTDRNGEIRIDNLMPGVYTVTEQSYDKYVPQESHRVTVLAGQTATVSFNNVLRRGDLTVTKTSEDGLNQGVKFHLFGTSLSGLPVDEFAVTDENGVATFKDVLIGTGYTLEEMDTVIRYVIPDSQSAAVEWNSVTNKSFSNILKKFNVTVTKSDCEVGTAQGDASLAGAAYGIYKGDQLVDTYYTDENGQFTTGYYVCGDDWTIREVSHSEGYLLDSTVYPVGAEAANYTVELNAAPAVAVSEQVQKGNIAIIKHSDNGDTQIETPEEGAIFAIYLKSAGRFQIDGKNRAFFGRFNLCVAVIRVLDDGDIALLHLLAHSHGRRSVQLNGVIGRLCTDRINGAVQKIALGVADLTNRPVVAADIIAGGELAVLVGVVGIHKLIALIDAVGGTGKRSITLRRSDLTVALSDGDIEFLEDVGKALIGYTVPFHCGALTVGNHIANDGVHLLQRVAGADKHILEGRNTVFIGNSKFIHGQTAERGSKKVELHTLVQSVLGGLGHGQITTAEYIVEGNRRRLPSEHGNTVAFLGYILVVALFSDGIDTGHQIVDANFTVPVGGNGLIDALAGDGEGNAVHPAVLAGLDDFSAAIADLQLEKRSYRVADGGRIGDGILNAAVGAVLIVRPNKNAAAGSASTCGDRHIAAGSRIGGDSECVARHAEMKARLTGREGKL